MNNKMRWRYGDTNPVEAAVDSDTFIEIGDLVWQDVDNVKPASMRRVGDLASKFLGVAMQRSRTGDTSPIRVATTGVYEFDCRAATFELGDLIGPDFVGTSGQAEFTDQQVKKVVARVHAIARVAKREPTNATTVLVAIRSTVMTDGIVER